MPSRLRRYDEPGDTHFWTISCYRRLQFFHDDGMKRVVITALWRLRQRFGICLLAYVIMPEHLHVLLYPHRRGDDRPVPISRLLECFKQHLGFYGKQRLRDVWRERRRLWSAPLNRWANGDFDKQEIMNTRGYDRNIFTESELREKVDYIHKNPITRDLVAGAANWPWSSYRYYELGDASLLPMDWDGAWPVVW
jgi:putative transposase